MLFGGIATIALVAGGGIWGVSTGLPPGVIIARILRPIMPIVTLGLFLGSIVAWGRGRLPFVGLVLMQLLVLAALFITLALRLG